MKTAQRLEYITALVNTQGYVSVSELSARCAVSAMTIRRDLAELAAQQQIERTHGGAASLRSAATARESNPALAAQPALATADVLIATTLSPGRDVMSDLAGRAVPLVAEALPVRGAQTLVAIDDQAAGYALGEWTAIYVHEHFAGRAHVLDLTDNLSNTQARSRGFLDALRAGGIQLASILSLNPQGHAERSYQLTRDALTLRPDINLIFAINDSNAWGAIRACRELRLPPERILVNSFGLEGDTLRNALMGEPAERNYCKVGLAMFPELIGPALVQAAILAYNGAALPPHIITPVAVLTRETLPHFYQREAGEWRVRADVAAERLPLPLVAPLAGHSPPTRLPRQVGVLVRYMEHEWYRNLLTAMRAYAEPLGVTIAVLDMEQTFRAELELRRREIARCAAQLVQPGEVVMVDGGPLAGYLAEELANRGQITVVSNARRAWDSLVPAHNVTLVSTGGVLRRHTDMLVGPTAEAALATLRADKLFLSVTGISLAFGLSHTDIPEVTIKQAMLRSAREVILVADHACFGREDTIQVAPLSSIHKLISDNGLPASWRLQLSQLGVQVILAPSGDAKNGN